ncbi:hypothetical protein [Dactylosporangium sp. CA-233914]|uniref:hypothetical protein n=1 Tax=Dactylosporangium sp. CA-233914 TaxID=3239934 RepID=UPI003D8AA0F1
MTRVRQFRLLVAGEIGEPAADALFGRAGDLCVEVLPAGGSLPVHPDLPGGSAWVAWVAFDRVAPTLLDAVVSGVRDLDVAGLGIAAAIADDSLVTPATIAERFGRAVAAEQLPASLDPRRPVFDWGEVVQRLGASSSSAEDEEAVLEAVSLTLRVRALGPRLGRLGPLRSLL